MNTKFFFVIPCDYIGKLNGGSYVAESDMERYQEAMRKKYYVGFRITFQISDAKVRIATKEEVASNLPLVSNSKGYTVWHDGKCEDYVNLITVF